MTREDHALRIRLPEPLKVKVQTEAAKNRRSMNAEIVSRLELSFSEENAPLSWLEKMQTPPHFSMDKKSLGKAVLRQRLEELEKRVTQLERRVKGKE